MWIEIKCWVSDDSFVQHVDLVGNNANVAQSPAVPTLFYIQQATAGIPTYLRVKQSGNQDTNKSFKNKTEMRPCGRTAAK